MTNWTSLQKELFCALVGLARAQDGNEWRRNKQTDQIVCQSLCLLADYPIASDSLLQNALKQVRAEKDRLSPGCSACASPCGRTEDLSWSFLIQESETIKTIKRNILLTLPYVAMKCIIEQHPTEIIYDALFQIGLRFASSEKLSSLWANLNLFSQLQSENVELNNQKYREAFEREHTNQSFTAYVLSEIQTPIEDYRNSIRLILEQAEEHPIPLLWLCAAEMSIYWEKESVNPALDLLKSNYDSLSHAEKAMFHYLQAKQIDLNSKISKTHNTDYRNELERSVSFQTQFVYNRIALAQISSTARAMALYQEALSFVHHAETMDTFLLQMMEDELDPKIYLNEFVLGVSISRLQEMDLQKEYQELLS